MPRADQCPKVGFSLVIFEWVGHGWGVNVHSMLITKSQILNQDLKGGSYHATMGGLLISRLQSRGLTARSWGRRNLHFTAAVRGSRLLMMAWGQVNRETGGHQISLKLIFHPRQGSLPSPPPATDGWFAERIGLSVSRGAFWGSWEHLASQMKCLHWAALGYLWPLAETPRQSHWDLRIA